MNNGGDVLARGNRSAQFSAGGSSVEDEIVLKNVAEEEPEEESLTKGVTVVDRRHAYDVKPVAPTPKKYADKTYASPNTILDRVLVKRIPDDPNMERMEDGSLRDKRTGFVIPAAYRQHNNVGIVLAVGQFVVLGGVKIPMSDVVRVGDRVTFGDYNSEVYKLTKEKTEKLCDAVQMNYEEDAEGLRVIRVQDVRTVEAPLPAEANDGGF